MQNGYKKTIIISSFCFLACAFSKQTVAMDLETLVYHWYQERLIEAAQKTPEYQESLKSPPNRQVIRKNQPTIDYLEKKFKNELKELIQLKNSNVDFGDYIKLMEKVVITGQQLDHQKEIQNQKIIWCLQQCDPGCLVVAHNSFSEFEQQQEEDLFW